MGFEDIPEDFEQSFPCDVCKDGEITKIDKVWCCSNCGRVTKSNEEN